MIISRDSNPELVKVISEEIRKRGPISFRDFMEMALYHPEFGYYTSSVERIGKEGDYYTSPHLTSLFGRLVGKQISEMGRLLGGGELDIVEIGAGKGLLALDILDFLKKENRHLYDRVSYRIIELNKWLKARQRNILKEHRVLWHNSLDELTSGIKGIFISNELVDSFPVHLITIKERRIKEIFIDFVDEKFKETLKDPSYSFLERYFEDLGVILSEGYRTEVNLEALEWIENVGKILDKGFIITIDYGYLSEELYQSYRSQGTLLCYYRHTTSEDPYARIGYQDITSHVNFSALIYWGKKAGLELTGFTDQAHFLINMGIEEYMKDLAKESKDYRDYLKRMLPVKNLLMPGMGETFKILIQHKGIERPSLRGLSSPFGKIS